MPLKLSARRRRTTKKMTTRKNVVMIPEMTVEASG